MHQDMHNNIHIHMHACMRVNKNTSSVRVLKQGCRVFFICIKRKLC